MGMNSQPSLLCCTSENRQFERMPGFKDQIALVTGASRGIGAATAIALATRGAHVVLVARNAKELESVEQSIFDAGGSATIAPLDLTDGGSIGRLASAISERWGRLDMLVLNAAMLGTLTPVSTIDGAEFGRLITLNLIAQQAMIAAFDQLLRKSDSGRLIAITSSVGAKPRAFWGAYGASKAALEALVISYSEEVKNLSPVRVAIVDPGKTRTGMRAQAYPGEDPASVKEPAAVAGTIIALLESEFATGHRLVIAS
jgi:NAD(P)-dependent dehydrogenase (short-subunit alcohol dehydrogenase family)